jgi:hypothetical protein
MSLGRPSRKPSLIMQWWRYVNSGKPGKRTNFCLCYRPRADQRGGRVCLLGWLKLLDDLFRRAPSSDSSMNRSLEFLGATSVWHGRSQLVGESGRTPPNRVRSRVAFPIPNSGYIKVHRFSEMVSGRLAGRLYRSQQTDHNAYVKVARQL